MEDNGIIVESIEVEDETIQVTYTTVQTEESALAEEMGYVTGGWAFLVGEGMEYPLEATILGATGEDIGWFEGELEWAEQYGEGEISDEELAERVLGTLEA